MDVLFVFVMSLATGSLIGIMLFVPSKNIYHITYVTQKGYNSPVYHSNFVEGTHPVAWILERRKHDVYTKYHLVHYDTHSDYRALMKVQEDLDVSRGFTNGNGQEA